jgi:hypothetical protein
MTSGVGAAHAESTMLTIITKAGKLVHFLRENIFPSFLFFQRVVSRSHASPRDITS